MKQIYKENWIIRRDQRKFQIIQIFELQIPKKEDIVNKKD